jgi:hypothetical protein
VWLAFPVIFVNVEMSGLIGGLRSDSRLASGKRMTRSESFVSVSDHRGQSRRFQKARLQWQRRGGICFPWSMTGRIWFGRGSVVAAANGILPVRPSLPLTGNLACCSCRGTWKPERGAPATMNIFTSANRNRVRSVQRRLPIASCTMALVNVLEPLYERRLRAVQRDCSGNCRIVKSGFVRSQLPFGRGCRTRIMRMRRPSRD